MIDGYTTIEKMKLEFYSQKSAPQSEANSNYQSSLNNRNDLVKIKELYAYLNPASYKVHYMGQQTEERIPLSNNTIFYGSGYQNKEFSFKLIFDDTGVLDYPNPPKKKVGLLKKAVQDLTTNEHRWRSDEGISYDVNELIDYMVNPYNGLQNLVRITWGSLVFWGVTKDMNVDYVLFNRKGNPIRATANIKLRGYQEVIFQHRISDDVDQAPLQRPTTESSDYLDISTIADSEYSDTSKAVDIAKANNLNSIRQNITGLNINLG